MKVSEAIKRLKRMDQNAELAFILEELDGYCEIISKFKTCLAVDASGDGDRNSFAEGVLRLEKQGNIKVVLI